MKKKALLCGLAVALLLVVGLIAYGMTRTGQTAQVEQPEAETSTPAPEEPTTTPEPTITPEPTTTPEPETTPEPPVPTQEAPTTLSNEVPATPDENETSQPPEEMDPQEPEVEEEPEVQLYTDCNETVYATGQVNIRESWSVSSTKLGSLSWGESVTRTGKPIAGTEAEGWSRVQLSDGSTAYIASSYLSTTKPVQQSTPSTNTGTGSGSTGSGSTSTGSGSTPGTGSTGTGSSSGGSDSPFTLWDPWSEMTEEEIERSKEIMQHAIDQSTGVLYPGGQKP